MELTGLHLLLTNRCVFECDHCFMWGSPWQNGVMTLENIRHILREGKALGTVTSIYFEGGEPFLYYSTLVKGVQEAVGMGFSVGLVTNAYWAISLEDALEWMRPMAGLIEDFSVSEDNYHGNIELVQNARRAATRLNIPMGTIAVAQPEAMNALPAVGQLPQGEAKVMYRGRAVEKLAPAAPRQPWEQFTECPHEEFRDPGRVHVDPFGNLHLCQGISIGNLFETPLHEIWAQYDPDANPITGALLAGGPAELVNRYHLSHEEGYADACHLCYLARQALRSRFPEILGPDEYYGIYDGA